MKLQYSDRYSDRVLEFQFRLNSSPKTGISSPKFLIFGRKPFDKKFSNSLIFRGPLLSATTPLVASTQFSTHLKGTTQ